MTSRTPKCPYCGSEDTTLMWCFYVGVGICYIYRCGQYFRAGKEAIEP